MSNDILSKIRTISNGEFKIHGDEAQFRFCPLCHGGDSRDKFTFSVNLETGAFNCARGKCAQTGNILAIDKKEKREYLSYIPQRQYAKPEKPSKSAVQVKLNTKTYLNLRKISDEVINSFRLYDTTIAGHDCIAFPFYDEKDELTFIQYRTIAQKGFTGSKDCKAILFGMWRINPDTKTLFIVEGPIDALSLATVGIDNVVSVPNGCKNMNWLEFNWEWLQQFDEFFIFGDNDDAGKAMVKELVDRLGIEKCFIVDAREKDANDVLKLHGPDALLTDCYSAKRVNLDTIQNFDPFEWNPKQVIECAYSGFRSLDELIGGFRINEFSLWTGVTGHGKTTFLNHATLNMIKQGNRILIYSGELSHQSLARTICLPCAGERNIQDKTVSNDILQKIKDFTDDRLFRYKYEVASTYNGKKMETRDLLRDFEIAYKRYGIKIFVIDNLMTASSTIRSSSNFYQLQVEFMNRVRDFVLTYPVHIHVVAHPKKVSDDKEAGEKSLTKGDLSGMQDITNMAWNVIAIRKKFEVGSFGVGTGKYLTILNVIKHRMEGNETEINFSFNKIDKRFTDTVYPEFYNYIDGITI